MTEITLEAAQAKLSEVAEMLAKLAKPLPATLTLAIAAATIELKPGEHYAGAVLDETTGLIKHHLVLMAEKPDERLNWQAAMDWAASVGGVLPTRQEQALLFANCKPHLDADWHWSSQTHESNSSYACHCYFGNGTQNYGGKSYAGCARAVRRVLP